MMKKYIQVKACYFSSPEDRNYCKNHIDVPVAYRNTCENNRSTQLGIFRGSPLRWLNNGSSLSRYSRE
jgi:hypothetical protein